MFDGKQTRWHTDIPESFVGAGDRGGAESFNCADSEDSLAISFGVSQSDFLFREPMAGFIYLYVGGKQKNLL